MEVGIILLVILLLYILIFPAIAFVSANDAKEQIRKLEKKIDDLKNEIRRISPEAFPPEKEPETSADWNDFNLERATPPETPEQLPEQPVAEIPVYQAAAQVEKPEISLSAVKPERNLEETISTRWAVWTGGLALALGAIFLVKYTIDQGWIGPAARIILAALFSAALLALGEYLRRNDESINRFGDASAHIPGILTGAGIVSAFATTYAAYSLYQFIGPFLAFVLLAACSLTALFAAALHGPWLSALGLLGSFITPVLVSTDTKNAWALFSYLGFIGVVSYALAFLRGSMWIAVTATAGSCGWALMWIAAFWAPENVFPLSLFSILLLAAAHIFLNRPALNGAISDTDIFDILERQDWIVVGIIAALAVVMYPIMRMSDNTDISIVFLAIAVLLLLGIAIRSPQLSVLPVGAALLFCLVYMTWHIPFVMDNVADLSKVDQTHLPWHLRPLAPPDVLRFLTVGTIFGGGFMILGFLAGINRQYHASWIITSAATPVLIFAFAYWKATAFETSIPFGLCGFLITGLYIYAISWTDRDRESVAAKWSSGIYAAAAVSALALSLTMLLEKGWLTVSFSLIALGLAWITTRRPVFGLRFLAAAIVFLVIARLLWQPTILAHELGTTPILNWLLYGYGIPAAAFALASVIFRKQKDDWVVQLHEAASILFIVVLIGQEIHHFMNNGNIYRPMSGLVELGLHTLSWLGLSLALQSFRASENRPVFYYGSHILGLLGLASVAFGLLVFENPMNTREDLGRNIIFNPLIIAYLLPSVLCLLIYFRSKDKRSQAYTRSFGIAAGVLAWAYLSLQVRRIFQGPVLAGSTSTEELYTYSAVWLLFGIALLAAGIWRNAPALRYGSCAVIMLTICKVFLFDMSNLTGILRALSFIGLGGVLIAIGYFYQKYVFPHRQVSEARTTE